MIGHGCQPEVVGTKRGFVKETQAQEGEYEGEVGPVMESELHTRAASNAIGQDRWPRRLVERPLSITGRLLDTYGCYVDLTALIRLKRRHVIITRLEGQTSGMAKHTINID